MKRRWREKRSGKRVIQMKNKNKINKKIILEVFNKPKIIGVIADTNQGKSMLLYNLIKHLKEETNSQIVSYGLRKEISEVGEFFSLGELEMMSNKVIIIDEFYTLFDLEDRKKARQIEGVLRLINHRNNILILCGTPDNFKKFISNQLNCVIYKKSTLGSFINGSSVKNICLNYKGYELGVNALNMEIDSFLLYDGNNYRKFYFDYLTEFDTKADNPNIVEEKCAEKMCENVENNDLIDEYIELYREKQNG